MELDKISGITVSDSITRPANTTIYTALDAASDVTGNAHFTFGKAGKSLVFPGNGNYGVISGARLHSSANQGTLPDMDLYLFRTDITAIADNAAFVVTDAEALTLIGVLEFNAFKALNVGSAAVGNAACVLNNLSRGIVLEADEYIYGQLVVQNAYTPVSGEVITCELDIVRYGH